MEGTNGVRVLVSGKTVSKMNIYIDYVRYKSIPNRSFGTILDQSPYQNVTLTQGKSIPFQLPRVSHICAGFQGS